MFKFLILGIYGEIYSAIMGINTLQLCTFLFYNKQYKTVAPHAGAWILSSQIPQNYRVKFPKILMGNFKIEKLFI
jgi:hypothetical protein